MLEHDISVRPAVEADGPALAELERTVAVVAGDERITVDRSADYFAWARLMEEVDVVVAEQDGEVIGVHCAAFHGVRLQGRDQRLNYIHHLRVAPHVRGAGVVSKLKEVAVPRYPRETTGSYCYVDTRNRSVSDRMAKVPAYLKWDVVAVRCEVDTRTTAADGTARPATAGDAADVAEILNRHHEGEELWVPLISDTLRARVERAPAQYGWERLWVADGAVLGVWPAGETCVVVTQTPDGRRESRQGLVLDAGFLPGAEPAFEGLVASWCAWLADHGQDTLTLFTTESSPVYGVLRPHVARERRFEFWTVRVERPERTDRFYVDHAYL